MLGGAEGHYNPQKNNGFWCLVLDSSIGTRILQLLFGELQCFVRFKVQISGNFLSFTVLGEGEGREALCES